MSERTRHIGMDGAAVGAAIAGLLLTPVLAIVVTHGAVYVAVALGLLLLELTLVLKLKWGVYLLVAGMLFNELNVSVGFATLGLGDLVLFALIPAWGARRLFGRGRIRLPQRGWVLVLYLTLLLVSMFNGVRPSVAYALYMRVVTYAVGLFIVVDLARDARTLRTIVWVIGACGLAHAIISMAGAGGAMRIRGLVDQPNELGVRLALGAIACAGAATSDLRRSARMVATGAMLVILLAILLTVSRGTYLSTTLAFAWWMRRQPRLMVTGLVVGTALLVTMTQLDPTRVGFINRRLEMDDSSVRGRLQVMKNSLVAVRERPLLGVGYGQFHLMEYAVEIGRERKRGAHNFYLGTVAAAGVPAGMLLAWFVFAAARGLVRRRKLALESADPEELKIAWLLGIVEVWLVYDLLSMMFRGGKAIMLFTLLGVYVAASMVPVREAEQLPEKEGA